MQSQNLNFRNHMFSVGSTELSTHKNLMACIIFGRKRPLVVSNDFEAVEAQIICIKPNVSHQVSVGKGGADIIYLDGLKLPVRTPAFRSLGCQFESLPNAISTRDVQTVQQIRALLEQKSSIVDPAIMRIVHRLYQPSIDRMSQNALSENLGLERTQALRHFKANTGQTFRKFKIWAAIISAAHSAFNGAGIGVSGIDSGFSDAAHVARTSRTLFGMTPTEGLQNLARVISL